MPENSILARDHNLVWHPYSAISQRPHYQVLNANGVHLTVSDSDGNTHELIDAMSSWWATVHGYRHPKLDDALTTQAHQFSHVMFGGLTHEPAVNLATQLTKLTPGELNHVFLADSGSVAIEVALKLAIQYHTATGQPRRNRFIALRGGYHGDTTGAMSICDPTQGMHAYFNRHLPQQIFLPRPPRATLHRGQLISDPNDVAQWIATAEQTIETHAHELAGVVIEPILQGAGGMHIYAPECLRTLRTLTTQHNTLLIADEIATGFGRTGQVFASQWANTTPDIMCLGKALTGGYLTLAAMLCTTQITNTLDQSQQPALLHGPTFMANPLACAVANASLEILTPTWQHNIQRLQNTLTTALEPARELPTVHDVRVLGGVGIIELTHPANTDTLTRAAAHHGVWLRPFRNLVYTMPPYISTEPHIHTIAHAMIQAISETQNP